MKIYVDDVRAKPADFDLLFRTGKDLLNWLKENPEEPVVILSLDHDFDETDNISGTQFCKEIVKIPNNIKGIQFHSDNLQGIYEMYHIFKNSLKSGEGMKSLRRLNPKKVGYDENDRFFTFQGFDARD